MPCAHVLEVFGIAMFFLLSQRDLQPLTIWLRLQSWLWGEMRDAKTIAQIENYQLWEREIIQRIGGLESSNQKSNR